MAGPRSFLLPPDGNTPATDPAIVSFFVLMIIGGNVLLPIMVLVMFVQGNKYCRSPIFMNFCIGWIVYSVGFLLSFYSGRWRRDVEPIPWLCQFEAVLAYVLPIWVAGTTLSLIFDLWMGVTGRKRGSSTDQESRPRLPLRSLILLIFPYFCALWMSICASLVSQARPDLVGFRAIFCTVDFQPLRMVVSVLSLMALTLGFGLLFDTGRRLYGKHTFGTARLDWRDKSLFIRMLIFLVILAIGGIAAIFAGTNTYKYPRQIIQGLFPLSAWLVFGTNPAIYKRDSGSDSTLKP